MSSPISPEPATIINVDTHETITCLFRPKEFSQKKQNSWTPGKNKATNVPALDFGGGQATTLTMSLFFDTFEEGADVRAKYTNSIWNLMAIDPNLKDKVNKKGRPPYVQFQWGKVLSFVAVVTSISQTFTLFLPNGTPVRSTLDVSFQQTKDPNEHPKQNPTSGGVGGERLWTVGEGDTLQWISYSMYGDAAQWRRIADANQLRSVRRLTPGTVLEIPNV
jgi:nucleoid-associated protein YgaU